jgi:Tol biopolymer transport system component
VNLGPLVNSAGNDGGPMLSFDGTTLYFNSERPGGYGFYDLYMITRTKIGN